MADITLSEDLTHSVVNTESAERTIARPTVFDRLKLGKPLFQEISIVEQIAEKQQRINTEIKTILEATTAKFTPEEEHQLANSQSEYSRFFRSKIAEEISAVSGSENAENIANIAEGAFRYYGNEATFFTNLINRLYGDLDNKYSAMQSLFQSRGMTATELLRHPKIFTTSFLLQGQALLYRRFPHFDKAHSDTEESNRGKLQKFQETASNLFVGTEKHLQRLGVSETWKGFVSMIHKNRLDYTMTCTERDIDMNNHDDLGKLVYAAVQSYRELTPAVESAGTPWGYMKYGRLKRTRTEVADPSLSVPVIFERQKTEGDPEYLQVFCDPKESAEEFTKRMKEEFSSPKKWKKKGEINHALIGVRLDENSRMADKHSARTLFTAAAEGNPMLVLMQSRSSEGTPVVEMACKHLPLDGELAEVFIRGTDLRKSKYGEFKGIWNIMKEVDPAKTLEVKDEAFADNAIHTQELVDCARIIYNKDRDYPGNIKSESYLRMLQSWVKSRKRLQQHFTSVELQLLSGEQVEGYTLDSTKQFREQYSVYTDITNNVAGNYTLSLDAAEGLGVIAANSYDSESLPPESPLYEIREVLCVSASQAQFSADKHRIQEHGNIPGKTWEGAEYPAAMRAMALVARANVKEEVTRSLLYLTTQTKIFGPIADQGVFPPTGTIDRNSLPHTTPGSGGLPAANDNPRINTDMTTYAIEPNSSYMTMQELPTFAIELSTQRRAYEEKLYQLVHAGNMTARQTSKELRKFWNDAEEYFFQQELQRCRNWVRQ